MGALALRVARGAAATASGRARVRERVERARERQRARYAGSGEVAVNAHVAARLARSHGRSSAEARALLTGAAERLGLTARGYHRVLRVARTIADLDDARGVGVPHVAEALRYRTTGESPGRARVEEFASVPSP